MTESDVAELKFNSLTGTVKKFDLQTQVLLEPAVDMLKDGT